MNLHGATLERVIAQPRILSSLVCQDTALKTVGHASLNTTTEVVTTPRIVVYEETTVSVVMPILIVKRSGLLSFLQWMLQKFRLLKAAA